MGLHCGAYYSNCAVIGHFTCQTATSLGQAGCHIVTRPFLSGRVGSFHMPDGYVTGSGGMSYCNQTIPLWEGGVWARDYISGGE